MQKEAESHKAGVGIAALVLGLIGVIAWIIPIIGLPIGIAALVFGIIGLEKSRKGMSIAGMVLGVVCLVFTTINSAIGAYQGFRGEAWFQKGINNQDAYVFTLRDTDGNILMTDGIESVNVILLDDANGERHAAVEIIFDAEAAATLADITEKNIGNTIGMYLNDDMLANPTVTAVITEGKCQVTGNTYEEAKKLAEKLECCK